MPRPKDERKERRMIEAGLVTLSRQGYHGTGLQQIVEIAGIPKGSFYAYFSSKEDFAAEVVQRYGKDFNTLLDELLDDPKRDGLEVLSRFFDVMIARFQQGSFTEGCLIGNLAGEVADESATFRRAMSSALEGWRDRFAGVIERAQREGSARTDIDATTLADFLLNAWEGSLLRMKIERSSAPLELCKALVIDDLMRAPAAAPAAKL